MLLPQSYLAPGKCGALADRCPKRDLAGVEADIGHDSAGLSWNSSRMSVLIFLQEQIGAM